MKPIPRTTLTKNVGDGREFCRYCGQTGFVAWNTGDAEPAWRGKVTGKTMAERQRDGEWNYPYGEEMAPCPFCEQGYKEEFPGEAKDRTKPPRIRTPWGEDGFWAGKDTAQLRPLYADGRSLPMPESRRHLQELRQRMGWIAKEMPE